MTRFSRWWTPTVVLAVTLSPSLSMADVLTLERYGEDPGYAIEAGQTPKPLEVRRLELTPLETVACDERRFEAKLKGKPVSVAIATAPLEPQKRRIDYAANTIDGSASKGHDGLVSEEYVRINLSDDRFVESVSAMISGRKHEIPKKHFVFMISPEIGTRTYCFVRAWWAAREELLVVSLGGSEGAGSYDSYMFFGTAGFRGQYWDWCETGGTWCATTLDPFQSGRKKQFWLIEGSVIAPGEPLE